METTVTMSLTRYKQLESYEDFFNKQSKGDGYTYYICSYGEYLISNSSTENINLVNALKSAIEMRDELIDSGMTIKK